MGIVFLISDVFLRILIGIIPLIMIQWHVEKSRKCWITALVIAFIQGCVYFATHCVLLRYVNFIHTAMRLIRYDYTYKELMYFSESMIICFIFSLILGIMLRKVITKNGEIWGRKRNQYVLAVFSATILFAGVVAAVSINGINNLIITEICSNNESVYIYEYESYCDYIELQHKGLFQLDGEAVYLSDDSEDMDKAKVTDIQLENGEYLLVGLTKDMELSVSKEGEQIYLYNENGQVIDSIYSAEQEESVAYSWMEAKGEWEMRTCTPGKDNELSHSLITLESPILSHESGFYEEPFELTLQTSKDYVIYYTLDGSTPTKDSICYNDSIYVYDKSAEPNQWKSLQNVVPNWKDYTPDMTPVDKAFIIRAAAFDADGNQSDIVTATYFIDKGEYVDKKVISLIADSEELFGADGMYVSGKEYDDWYLYGIGEREPLANFRKNSREHEILANFQLFEGECVAEQNAGIRIQGGSSKKSAIKRFSVIARKEWCGSKWFDYELFEDKRSHSVTLREGFINAVSPYLAQGRNFPLQQSIPVEVFLNGEHWYSTYMQEKICEAYIEELYGLQEDNVVIVKNEVSEDAAVQREYEELCDFVANNDMSDVANYTIACQQMDMQSFIDFFCVNVYLCNMDWEDYKNHIFWKCREITDNPYEDGRFRWVLYDMDSIELLAREWDSETICSKNAFSEKGLYISTRMNQTKLYKYLKDNPDFREQFVLSFMDIANTCFSEENVSAILEEWGEDISWHDSFFIKRKDYVFEHLKEEFQLNGTCEKLTVQMNDKDAGIITVNTATLSMEEEPWEGYYFTDYPVTISVSCNPGYRFKCWKDSEGNLISTEDEVRMEITEGGIDICAVFEKDE